MMNRLKTVFLLGLLTGLLILIGGIIGGKQGLFVGLIFSLLMNFLSYWFSDKFILMIYRAKEIKKGDMPWIHSMVEDLANRAKIPKPRIYLIPNDVANAFATGRNPKHAAVAVTEGILHLLSKEELKGVLAHELSHVKNRDILISTIAATIAGVISYLAAMARFAAIFGGDRNGKDNNGNIIGLLILAILAPLMTMILQFAISRSREFLADESGAKIIHDGRPLAEALEKLERNVKIHPLIGGNQATAHMFIVNPFTTKSLINLFSTHPSTEQRINKLKTMKFNF